MPKSTLNIVLCERKINNSLYPSFLSENFKDDNYFYLKQTILHKYFKPEFYVTVRLNKFMLPSYQ